MLLYYSVYYILFVHYDALAIQKLDLLLNDKLSLPKAIGKHENEVLLLTSSHMKSVNDKKPNKMIAFTDKHVRAMKNGIKKEVKSYVNHLIHRAFTKLVSNVKYFKAELNYGEGISNIIYRAQRNYSSKFQNYSEKLTNDINPMYDIDKQFIIFDLTESSNRLLLNECREILILMLNQSQVTKYVTYKLKVFSLSEALLKFIAEAKKEDMEYVCEHYDICRHSPAYSDYISDLIKELLKLPDVKLKLFFTHLKLLFNEQANLIQAILTNELASELSNNLRLLFNENMVKVRNNLVELREILTNKHKLTRSKDTNINIQYRSMTMLINIIDKAFDRSDAEIVSIYFDNTFHKLKRWNEVENQDITVVLGNFVRYFADSIKYNWKPETHEEVKVLVEVIMNGNSTNENVYEYLFTTGSKYLNSKSESDLTLSL